MSTILKHLFKFLDQHEAQLTIDTHAEPPELILRLPARITADGTIARYAQEYRLGSQLPQTAMPLLDPLDTDPA